MIDSVLKGTGNSRFLKSAVPAGTSWADALAMLRPVHSPLISTVSMPKDSNRWERP